ncbi:DUF1801 domain-containing protein [Candidatus Bathyarchaeota archaeon]|nr:MAG: DUF1801 domain-containing protein [Candidatus Bathyarchaeota archaeon]TMI60050.1 MAG: DUF1801 domain-containing protein [Candidatus Bathyarchaeota archaeon]
MIPSKFIDQQIIELTDWRGKTMAKLRKIVHDSDPAIAEEWKWNTAVYAHNGLVLAVGAFKGNVKMNFFLGASLPDLHKLFNAGLEAKKTRAIDLHEEDKINEPALKDLIRTAVAQNRVRTKR